MLISRLCQILQTIYIHVLSLLRRNWELDAKKSIYNTDTGTWRCFVLFVRTMSSGKVLSWAWIQKIHTFANRITHFGNISNASHRMLLSIDTPSYTVLRKWIPWQERDTHRRFARHQIPQEVTDDTGGRHHISALYGMAIRLNQRHW